MPHHPATAWISVAGRTTRYRRVEAASGGLPIVLVHGIACSSAAYGPVLAHLAAQPRRERVLAPDMPGYGRSRGPRRALGVVELGGWLAEFLDATGVERAHVVGHSMGCQVALALARLHPQRVASAALIGPTTGSHGQSLLRYGLGLLADSVVEAPAWNVTLMHMWRQMGLRRYVATLRTMLRDRPIALAQQVRCPTLVLRGTRDAIIPDRAAARLAAALPRGRIVRVPQAAHAAQFSRPAEVCAVLEAFWREVAGETGL